MKKLFVVAAIAISTYAANAAYLYWQVDDSAVNAYNAAVPEGWYSVGSGAYAILRSTADSSVQPYATYDAEGQVTEAKAPLGGAYYSNIGTDAGYSYFVELYNSDNRLIAKSAAINSSSGADWTAAYAETARTTNLAAIPSVNIWHAGNFRAVPEPTSAILMLFGAAMLGLKRKNRSLN